MAFLECYTHDIAQYGVLPVERFTPTTRFFFPLFPSESVPMWRRQQRPASKTFMDSFTKNAAITVTPKLLPNRRTLRPHPSTLLGDNALFSLMPMLLPDRRSLRSNPLYSAGG